jgi:hypothetical protein
VGTLISRGKMKLQSILMTEKPIKLTQSWQMKPHNKIN